MTEEPCEIRNAANARRYTVLQELDDLFGSDKDRDILASDLQHMVYLECALKETLRFFPPVPIFARVVSGLHFTHFHCVPHRVFMLRALFVHALQATQDVHLRSGQAIPAGSYVAVLPLWTHRNPRHFPDPERFDPERFTPENSRDRHPYAFVPFR